MGRRGSGLEGEDAGGRGRGWVSDWEGQRAGRRAGGPEIRPAASSAEISFEMTEGKTFAEARLLGRNVCRKRGGFPIGEL